MHSIVSAPTVEHLSQVLLHATAPAFLLAALASFITLLISRMNGIIDRIRTINAIQPGEEARLHLKGDLPRLKLRNALLHKAIRCAAISAIITTMLIAWSFAAAIFNMRHEYGAAILFIIALTLFGIALWQFTREIAICVSEFDDIH